MVYNTFNNGVKEVLRGDYIAFNSILDKVIRNSLFLTEEFVNIACVRL